MNKSPRSWQPVGDNKLLYEFLPNDTSRQRSSFQWAVQLLNTVQAQAREIRLLDLGCGTGDSYDKFSSMFGGIQWIGMDILDSAEVAQRSARRLTFCSYDGVQIPLRDDCIDVIYSHQVFEHVRHPESLISEIYRVLKPNGLLVGSTSHLEPFHSRSYWNYTPYGFCVLLRDAGFSNIQVRPGIDSLTLIGRSGLRYLKLANAWNGFFDIESPLNAFFELILRILQQPASRRNCLKLLFSGQFSFFGRKVLVPKT